jgi:hypothetical protein
MRTAAVVVTSASLASLLLVACSSSSSSSGSGSSGTITITADGGSVTIPNDIGGTQASCPASGSNDISTTQACIDCQVRNCKAKLQAVVGSDPKAYGGACAPFFQCVCACPANDATGQCAFGCFSKIDAACQAAQKASDECIAASCRNDAGTGVCPNEE